MAVKAIQNSFNGGEQSPRMRMRADVEQRRHGCSTLLNCHPLVQGGAISTYGSEFVAEAKNGDKNTRLFSFNYAETDALMIEVTEGAFRFFDQNKARVLDASGNIYEVANTYTSAQIPEINIKRGANTVLMFHPDVPIKRLRRFQNDNWVFDDFPLDPAPSDEIGILQNVALTLSATTGSGITVTAAAAAFLNADIGRDISWSGGNLTITAFTSDTIVTADVTSDFPDTAIPGNEWTLEGSPQTTVTPAGSPAVGNTTTFTASAAAWRSTDVGAILSINGGYAIITQYTSATAVTGKITQVMTAAVASPAGAWSILYPIYSDLLGYPRDGDFLLQRLVLAGSNAYPNGFAASRIRLFSDFTLGDFNDDAFFYELDLNTNNPIINIGRRKKGLFFLTAGQEVFVGPNEEGLFTPTRISVDDVSEYGSARVSPLRADQEFLYVQAGARKIRAARYSFVEDEFDSSDITKLSEHITETGIVNWAYQKEPDSFLWLVLANGTAVCYTLDKAENVRSPARQTSNGLFKDFAAMEDADGSTQIWCVVERDIDGSTVQYIESKNTLLPTIESGLILTSGSPQTSWSGLDHLEGETVKVMVDGVLQDDAVVSSGAITTKSGTEVIAGLELPDTPTIGLFPVAYDDDSGSIQGDKNRNINANVILLESGSIKFNGQLLKTQQFGADLLDEVPPRFTGSRTLPAAGYNFEKEDTITAATIEPIHVLGIVRNVDVNQRDR